MIVAELSTTWNDQAPYAGKVQVSARFEAAIEFNARRGYVLHSWQFQSVAVGGIVIETIIAVFKKLTKENLDENNKSESDGH